MRGRNHHSGGKFLLPDEASDTGCADDPCGQKFYAIIGEARGKLPGDVAGIEIEHEGGRWRYEFRVVDSQGRLFEVYVDARSGEIERIKEK